MLLTAWILLALPIVLVAYAYLIYPLVLRLVAGGESAGDAPSDLGEEWPMVSISMPVYNEEAQIRGALDSLLRLDYPADRLQIVVISDASTDGTDAIVAEYADRGVELLRMARRGGKTAGENAAARVLRGDIVVNTDASIRIHPDALKPLIRTFSDPTVGVASGRDVSVARIGDHANVGEAGYVGYEMGIRALETRAGGIIGASGCFYAIRTDLHRSPLPGHLSRDFASALVAKEHGYRAVSVDSAVCFVPRTASLRREYYRKVRTIARGMQTLQHKRHLLNPSRAGGFAWMLFSHKVVRWVVPWSFVPGLAGLLLLATHEPWARVLLAGAVVVMLAAPIGWLWPAERKLPRIIAVPAFAIMGNLAALHAGMRAIHGDTSPIWEPTRRDVIATGH